MAEVFIAKSFGIEGFEKIIAIKRILPTMAEDDDFIDMFIDEAKIAGHLSHANIVPIYELGKIGDSHYIAMEFIWGKDLLQIMNRFRRMRKRMPAPMVAFIAGKMCEALEYAHTKRDRSGQLLNLIHRDISPQNILVSYDGAVKLIDFGIAKAASRTTKTQAGVLKGKFGYMSPEQVRGLPIDKRSDIFAVGTCMYEMLTADRLFVGESDFSTLEKVRHAQVQAPSELVPGIPPEFDEIVMKSLAREPADRYQTAGDLQEALAEFLAVQRPPFTTNKLANWMKSAFEKEANGEKGKLDGYAQIGRPSVLGSPSAPPPPAPAATARPPARPPPPAPPPPVAAPDEFGGGGFQDDDGFGDDLVGEATVVGASPFDEDEFGGGFQDDDMEGEATQIFFSADDMELIEDPPPATAPVSGQGPSVQVFQPPGAPAPAPTPAPAPMPGAPRMMPTPGPGRPAVGGGPVGDDRPTMMGEPAPAPAPAPSPGFAMPPGGGPGGQRAMPTAELSRIPTGEIPAPAQAAPETSNSKKIAIGAAAAVLLVGLGVGGAFLLMGGKPDVGSVEIRTVPDVGAEIRIDGTVRGNAPARVSEIPVGRRVVEIIGDGYRPVRREVDVGAGATALLEVVLISQSATQVAANSTAMAQANPQQATTAMVTAPEVTMEAETETTETAMEAAAPPEMVAEMVAAMTSTMTTEMESSMVQRIERTENTMTIMRIERTMMESPMRARGRGTLVVNSHPWSQVFVDGRRRGNTPLPSLMVPAGSHRVELRTSDGRTHRETVEVENGATARVIHRF